MENGVRFFWVRSFWAFFAVLAVLALWQPAAKAQEATAPSPGSVEGAVQTLSPKAPVPTEEGAEGQAPDENTASGTPAAVDSSDVDETSSAQAPRVYLDPSVQNLSRLYWALGMFDLEKDDVAVSNYVMINECQIYRDYYTDDFEWSNVREAERAYLRKNMKSFSRRFEFIQPIELGRYNEDTQTFEVMTESVTKGSRLLYGDVNSRNSRICDKRGEIDGYPRNVIVSLSRPIHYPQIPVNTDAARDYIARAKIRNEEDFRDVSENIAFSKLKDYQRLAFIVVKVRMIKFIEMRNARDGVYPVIFAALEGVEIYEDPKKKRLLYSSLARTKTDQ